MSSDPMRTLFADTFALGREHGVDDRTTVAVLGLQIMAMLEGCETPAEGLAWAVERGYVRDKTGEGLGGRAYDPAQFEVTNAGVLAVAAYRDSVVGE